MESKAITLPGNAPGMFPQVTLQETEVYNVLSNARRRDLLGILWASTDAISLRDLSERLATVETGESPAPRSHRESVYNALHQTHLPKLDALGLVDYDPDRKVVRALPEARQLGRYMDVTTRVGVTWGEYYRGLGIVGLFATTASLAGVPVFADVSPLFPATLFLGLFAFSTLYQLAIADSGLRRGVGRLVSRSR